MSASDHPLSRCLTVEVAWEVCRQLGGIYTVLRSKAPVATRKMGSRYCLLGPWNKETAAVEFEPSKPTGPFGRACQMLAKRGIVAHYGHWLVTGRPQVVLLDIQASWDRIAQYKYYLWKDHHIETRDEHEVNDVVLFGYLAAEFFQVLCDVVQDATPDSDIEGTDSGLSQVQLPILAQFHEWMAGVPIPIIRMRNLPVRCVFTTHATLLGRYIASSNAPLYESIDHIDPFHAAAQLNIMPRYSIERAAVHGAHVFTTVSEITRWEAERLLGRRAEFILPNGLNIQRFSALHEFQNLHAHYKKRIHEFVMGHFFPSYDFDLEHTVYTFISGRYEFHNKGIDLFLDSLARLNFRLKMLKSPTTVVAFVITRAATRAMNVDVLKRHVLLGELRNTVNAISGEIGERILLSASRGRMPQIEDLMDDYGQLRLKRMIHAWRQDRWPAVVTHDLHDEGGDPIMQKIRQLRLFNQPDDPVKIVYHPEFLSSTSPLVGLDYDQFVRGAHLGVFPSYYEPWGYTPMECVALGVPTVTSDLAGFGGYVQEHIKDPEKRGIHVVERRGKDWNESANQLADSMQQMLTLSRRDRIDLRNRVESLSPHFDWQELARNYWEAYHKALGA
jgi:glycogen(starch) synthase